MIVMTDGESHDSPQLVQAVADSERDNITLYAIAVSLSRLTCPLPLVLPSPPSCPTSVVSGSPPGPGLLQPSRNQPRNLPQRNQVHRQRPRREALL